MTDFPTFWQNYPRKVGKLAAMKAWAKAITLDSPENIIAGVGPYKANKPDYQDWAHPTTWLNQGRWMDEYEAPPQRLSREEQERMLKDIQERVRARNNPVRLVSNE